MVAYMMARTRMEERILVENPDGCAGYMESVPYRWFPGVW